MITDIKRLNLQTKEEKLKMLNFLFSSVKFLKIKKYLIFPCEK